MRLRTIPARDLDEGLVAAWDALCLAHPLYRSPYLSPHFTAAAGAVRDDVFVTVMEEGDRPVGFFPHQRQGRRGLPVAHPLNDCQAVIAAPAAEWAPRDLLAAAGLTLWDFDHVVAGQREFAPFARLTDVSPVIDLGQGFDGYAEELRTKGSKRIKKLNRQRRVLERDHGTVETIALDRDAEALSCVMDWKLEQCLRTGTRPYFREKWAVSLVDRLMALEVPGCSGALSVVRTDGRIVAAHFGIRSRDVWHWWFPVYDDDFAVYSPGAILLLDICERVGSDIAPQRLIDLGRGDDPYKSGFANAAYEIIEGHVSRGSAYAAARGAARAARGWARTTPCLAPLREARKAWKERGGQA